MELLTNNIGTICGGLAALAFVVNIIVEVTKDFIPVPTKAWAMIVSCVVSVSALFIASAYDVLPLNASNIILSVLGSFIVAYVSMYGFDTFKDLWNRFQNGGV